MMIALDAGAEDIKSSEDGFEVITEPAAFDAVEKALADNNIEVEMSEITMVPDTMAELSGEDAEKVQKCWMRWTTAMMCRMFTPTLTCRKTTRNKILESRQ